MAKQRPRLLLERTADLGQFSEIRAAGAEPFLFENLIHVYIHLDFKENFERATNQEDARKFFRSVARASLAANAVASTHRGRMLEIQGAALHISLPAGANPLQFSIDLHGVLDQVFNDPAKRVQGWRIAIDEGPTFVITGRGIHNDDSTVSLGRAANRPAKYLHSQVLKTERDQRLKRFHVARRNPESDRWDITDLRRSQTLITEAKTIAENARHAELRIRFVSPDSRRSMAQAQARPIPPSGSNNSPSSENPLVHFGWVMRADLDGFTSRVDQCMDDAQMLEELAEEFHAIMGVAARFADQHSEAVIQLPWAGDNFTAAAVFPTRADYDQARKTRLIELSTSFEIETEEALVSFRNWAHSVSGGDPTGASKGNVYVAGIEIDGRRYLVGVGEGFGRSSQGFTDVVPKGDEMVLYTPDWEKLEQKYRDLFKPATNQSDQQSTLFRIAKVDDLCRVNEKEATATPTIEVRFRDSGKRQIPVKPHFSKTLG